MQTTLVQTETSASRRIGFAVVVALAALTYLVLLGGTAVGELSPAFALVNALVAAPLLAAYLWRSPRHADRVDRLVLLAVVLFTFACVLSLFPRQSFEAAVGAVTYAAAFFVTRGMLSRSAARAALTWTLIGLSAALTTLTAARWGVFLFEWMTLVDWRTAPPLNMELPSIPWGHRHDLALVVVMLYPAWWVGHPSATRRAVAVAVGILVTAIVFIGGSRTLWLAIIVSSGLTGALVLRPRMRGGRTISGRAYAGGALVAGAIVLVLAATGLGGTLVERLSNLDSVGWRTAMWSALVDWWMGHPIAGGGPGSFPWLLQGTTYFDATSFAPRHPDSAPIQLLAEGGLLGIGALVALLAAVVPRLFRAMSPAAVWALLTFAGAALASNPTDFAFLVIIAITWAAYAIPRPSSGPVREAEAPARLKVMRGVTVVGALAASAAWLLTAIAAIAYGDARGAIAERDFPRAAEALEAAAELDPGMALYPRQLGTLRLVMGNPADALGDLRTAVTINPRDDLAWRTLALAADDAEEPSLADRALAEALDTQRSDPTNLLLAAERASRRADHDLALELLAEAVQAWPAIAYAPGWHEFTAAVGPGSDEVVARAADRWLNEDPSPELVTDQGLWLAAMAGRNDALARGLAESGYSDQVGSATIALIGCTAASEILEQALNEDLRTAMYWRLISRDGAVTGTAEGTARELVELITRRRTEGSIGSLNPLHENAVRGTSTDLWGYRRASIDWPSIDHLLPSPTGGLAAWTEGDDCGR